MKGARFLSASVVFAVLLSSTPLTAGHESMGGNDTKLKFKQIGRFIMDHILHKQVRLRHRIENFEKLRSVLQQPILHVVSEFPAEYPRRYNEILTAMTIEDDASPVGRVILIHEENFNRAYERFVAGENVLVQSLSGSVHKRQSQPSYVDFEERTFLSFCLHEILNVAGEDDEGSKISQHFSGTRNDLKRFLDSHSGLKDTVVTVNLGNYLGDIVEGGSQLDCDQLKRQSIGGLTQLMSKPLQHEVDTAVETFSEFASILELEINRSDIEFLCFSFLAQTNRYIDQEAYIDVVANADTIGALHMWRPSVRLVIDADAMVDIQLRVDHTCSTAPYFFTEIDRHSQPLHDRQAGRRALLAAFKEFIEMESRCRESVKKHFEAMYPESFVYVEMFPVLDRVAGEKKVSYQRDNHSFRLAPKESGFRVRAVPRVIRISKGN